MGLLVVAYASLLFLYAVSGRTRGVGEDASVPPGGVFVDLHAEAVQTTPQRLVIDVDLEPDPSLGATPNGLTLDRDITVLIEPSAGSREVTFPAGQVPAVNRVELELDGDIRNWPFDRYSAALIVGVVEGSVSDGRALEAVVQIGGEVQGWRVNVTEADVPGAPGDLQFFRIEASRSGDTLAFAAIILVVMIVLASTACFVAVTTLRGRRVVQPTFMSWMAAMLFATVPLRNFLPGSPPVGSWVDAVIVLWVIVALVVSLAMYGAAWYRQTAPSDTGRP